MVKNIQYWTGLVLNKNIQVHPHHPAGSKTLNQPEKNFWEYHFIVAPFCVTFYLVNVNLNESDSVYDVLDFVTYKKVVRMLDRSRPKFDLDRDFFFLWSSLSRRLKFIEIYNKFFIFLSLLLNGSCLPSAGRTVSEKFKNYYTNTITQLRCQKKVSNYVFG